MLCLLMIRDNKVCIYLIQTSYHYIHFNTNRQVGKFCKQSSSILISHYRSINRFTVSLWVVSLRRIVFTYNTIIMTPSFSCLNDQTTVYEYLDGENALTTSNQYRFKNKIKPICMDFKRTYTKLLLLNGKSCYVLGTQGREVWTPRTNLLGLGSMNRHYHNITRYYHERVAIDRVFFDAIFTLCHRGAKGRRP